MVTSTQLLIHDGLFARQSRNTELPHDQLAFSVDGKVSYKSVTSHDEIPVTTPYTIWSVKSCLQYDPALLKPTAMLSQSRDAQLRSAESLVSSAAASVAKDAAISVDNDNS